MTDPVETYRIGHLSRVLSLTGHRDVMTGRAKFGAFGDGKELPQLAMAGVFRDGDWRAGYYRDQTFMMAAGLLSAREFFAQLYADTDVTHDPHSGGRMMGNHFATRYLDENGAWLPQVNMKNAAGDVSAVAAQMTWMLGLAYASKLYRLSPELSDVNSDFSRNGDEVVFGTIGNAATSEGHFFETVNAAGVLQVPLVMSVWDDGYGISVPNHLQTTKGSISSILTGFAPEADLPGVDIYTVKGWDYEELCATYERAVDAARSRHAPAVVHVTELTQPLGHSTSGSHARYKSKERLAWEKEHDCLARMREWVIQREHAPPSDLDEIEKDNTAYVRRERAVAWEEVKQPIVQEAERAAALLDTLADESAVEETAQFARRLRTAEDPSRKLIREAILDGLAATLHESQLRTDLKRFEKDIAEEGRKRYRSLLYSETPESPLQVAEVAPAYSDGSELVDGRVVLVRCFEERFAADPRVFVIGEDVGVLGDVNLVFEGLHEKFGQWRLTDTGIREATIMGQGIGSAMRGLRPIVDIQYLDYFLWALQPASDQLATLYHRTAGGQKAPVVVRTKGHRLQGMWHAGSPMAVLLHACRGMYLCVPRDMTRAAGMYNTLFQGDNPAIVVEALAGYRTKERIPDNVGSFTVPLGKVEVLREGADVTVLTYGALCSIAMQAAVMLQQFGVEVEVIDVQTLNPFDLDGRICASLRKTNAVLFLDEDVPGGASAYMMQKVLEEQEGWGFLDAPPRTLTASESRTPYATDGDYFGKPSRDDIVTTVYEMVQERDPARYQAL